MAGAVRADMDSLRVMLDIKGDTNEGVLSMCLQAAARWIYDRVTPASVRQPEVAQAVLLLASRLYKRRLSPEGVAGWDDMGVIRVLSRDPDVERLIEQYVDARKVWGIA